MGEVFRGIVVLAKATTEERSERSPEGYDLISSVTQSPEIP